jgi:hypothetical protein
MLRIHRNIDNDIINNYGENSRTASITEATAQAILDARPADYRPKMRGGRKEVAEKHGVSVHHVTSIWSRRTWKHLKRSE